MKRILTLVLAMIFCLGFVISCENEQASPSSIESNKASQELSSSSEPSSTLKNEGEPSISHRLEHYSVLSTATEGTIEVLTSYEELVAFAQSKELYIAHENDAEELVEFDTAVIMDKFDEGVVLAVPQGFQRYEDIYYKGLEMLENGVYVITAVVTTNYDQPLEPVSYNFDFVIVPSDLYKEDMKQKEFMLEAEFKSVLPTYNIPDDTPYNNKIENSAKEKLHTMNEGEYISLSIFLASPPKAATQGSGYTDSQIASIKNKFYSNFASYKQEHGDMELTELPVDAFRKLSGLVDSQILNDTEIRDCLASVGGLDYTIKLYGIYEDQREYRQSVKNANISRNEEFCALLDMTKCRNVYKDSLICMITVECERDYVLVLQEMKLVESIYWNNPDENIFIGEFDQNACE
ncbi:MAG: hypothetical protein IKA43_02500 [Clostridia bacterium]|nr:hypothetical protein [Clostridia bacterium]